ncbi:MAG: glycosyl hydrolase 115 family protein [Oscillospiraceae bacterium]|nr:glycosyl hydrolase 115 family protein [Oscillospiraceae bacterium]
MIINARTHISLVYPDDCPTGIIKTAEKVKRDLRLVTGDDPCKDSSVSLSFQIDADDPRLAGKREVYSFEVSGDTIRVRGSDKRGVIYGLYHISELAGVSPFVNWAGLVPPRLEYVGFDEGESISKEPSVKYRGFFINDEWPAFGNWCMKRFGGVNSEMYEQVFELLLRLKGNYLWPAMWASCFSCEGPGLRSAELADEYGVIMGTSHHEPCMCHGEEYSRLRGKDSPYGDAWDFAANREGITRFWEDGLKRNAPFENVITVGMRGERDSTILGSDSTLADNIALLKDVIAVQNRLIRENVNSDLGAVPRMLALYKEVEPYYYGSDDTPGLMGYSELDDVILMLCDDNHGYCRTLPDEQMRRHTGGYGMYYHFDYHGDPVSYEWIDSTCLPVVREQMSAAFEHGVDTLWIVNVGDLALNEVPLSYFLDLAYDFDRWGIYGEDTDVYLKEWFGRQFGGHLSPAHTDALARMYARYGQLMFTRRPEHMDENVYRPQKGGLAEDILAETFEIEKICDDIEEHIPDTIRGAYTELVSYKVRAGMNHVRMWIYAAYDRFYAAMGAVAANRFAEMVAQALSRDRELVRILHTAGNGRFDGLGLAPHAGFKHWNSEESANPVLHTVIPVQGAAMKVGLMYEEGVTAGLDWTKKTLHIRYFRREGDTLSAGFFCALCGTQPLSYTVECDRGYIALSRTQGELSEENDLIHHIISIDTRELSPAEDGFIRDTARITVKYPGGAAEIEVHIECAAEEKTGICCERNGIIRIPAECFIRRSKGAYRFEPIEYHNGKALKVMPQMTAPLSPEDAPYVEYSLSAACDGEYLITFETAPNNPYSRHTIPCITYSINKGKIHSLPVVEKDYTVGSSPEWAQGVLTHARLTTRSAHLRKGTNTLRIYGTHPELVLIKCKIQRMKND